ncbi:hypothetical protein D3C86_1919920 [compost metagenome]
MGHFAIPGSDGHPPKPRVDQLTRTGCVQRGQQTIALRQAVIPDHKPGEFVLPSTPPQVFDKGLIALGEFVQLSTATDVDAVGIQPERHPSKGGALFSFAPFTHYGLLPSVR